MKKICQAGKCLQTEFGREVAWLEVLEQSNDEAFAVLHRVGNFAGLLHKVEEKKLTSQDEVKMTSVILYALYPLCIIKREHLYDHVCVGAAFFSLRFPKKKKN